MRRALVPVIAASLLLAACFGPFRATRGVWEFNKDVSENKWVEELVFLALVIVPIYQLASLGDVVIFNTIEFWTGENPFEGGGSEVAELPLPDGSTATVTRGEDGALTVRRGEEILRLERHGETLVLLDEAGAILAAARRDADGDLELVRAEGDTLVVPAAELARVQTSAKAGG